MPGNEWSQYLEFLKSEPSFAIVKKYVSDKKELKEQSTDYLRYVFPVDDIVLLPFDDDFRRNSQIEEKILCIKNAFEIYFGYARNLLMKFFIYKEKYILTDTPQVSNLRILRNYSDYLSLIGYVFNITRTEWKFDEAELTNERKIILQCMLVCCCVGHEYYDNTMECYSLPIFADHHQSLDQLLYHKTCEMCDFDIDAKTYSCSVCLAPIFKMQFFNNWRRKFATSLKTNQNVGDTVHSDIHLEETKSCPYCLWENGILIKCYKCQHSKNLIEEPVCDQMIWICKNCTTRNLTTNLNCSACMSCRETFNNSGIVTQTLAEMSNDASHYNEVDSKNFRSNQLIEKLEKSVKSNNENVWICLVCTTSNSDSLSNCLQCYRNRMSTNELENFDWTSSLKNDHYNYSPMQSIKVDNGLKNSPVLKLSNEKVEKDSPISKNRDTSKIGTERQEMLNISNEWDMCSNSSITDENTNDIARGYQQGGEVANKTSEPSCWSCTIL